MLSVKLPKGKYIVAVSGGVDSMVLLDLLRRQKDAALVVAHLNHGIRSDSDEDEKLVHHYAMSHNIKFISESVRLGVNASEETARNIRYEFLRRCRNRFKANLIVTAQHQDDLVETVIINLLRGTGWRGLAPFIATSDVIRPLINLSKSEIIAYAKKHQVPWREDLTNQDQKYLRNYVRNDLLPRLEVRDAQIRTKLLRLIRSQQQLRRTIEQQLDELLTNTSNQSSCDRHLLIMAPTPVAYELLQRFIFNITGATLIGPLANKALIFAKTARPAKTMPLNASWRLRATGRQLIVEPDAPMLS